MNTTIPTRSVARPDPLKENMIMQQHLNADDFAVPILVTGGTGALGRLSAAADLFRG